MEISPGSTRTTEDSEDLNLAAFPDPVHYVSHELTADDAISTKCLTLRVARLVWVARTIQAIIVSRSSRGQAPVDVRILAGNTISGSCIYPIVTAFKHPATLKAKGMTMLARKISLCLLAAAMATPVFTTGCGGHAYYDPYYHDYHPVDGEVVYYQQWEGETHRQHVDLKHRNKAEQKEYWDWRHQHMDKH